MIVHEHSRCHAGSILSMIVHDQSSCHAGSWHAGRILSKLVHGHAGPAIDHGSIFVQLYTSGCHTGPWHAGSILSMIVHDQSRCHARPLHAGCILSKLVHGHAGPAMDQYSSNETPLIAMQSSIFQRFIFEQSHASKSGLFCYHESLDDHMGCSTVSFCNNTTKQLASK